MSSLERFSNHTVTSSSSSLAQLSSNDSQTTLISSRIPKYHSNMCLIVTSVTMLLITLLDDNEAKPPIIVAYLRKRNVVLSHCYNSANVIEPKEPHTCNNTVHKQVLQFAYCKITFPCIFIFNGFVNFRVRCWSSFLCHCCRLLILI
jgi:hypothetical protein